MIGRKPGAGDEWQVLAEVEDAGLMLESGDEPKAWLIPVENRQKFQSIGLNILSTRGDNHQVCLHNMLMWEDR